jgi:hypothetical protein
MRTLGGVSWILTFLACANLAWAGPQVQSARAYRGPDGVRVQVLRLDGPEPQALVRVQNSDTDLDGKILLYEVDESDARTEYRTQRGGRDYTALRVESAYGGRSVVLYLPGRGGELSLAFDEADTQALDAPALVAVHEKQAGDGTLGKYQGFDRAAEMKDHEASLAQAAQAMNAACGGRAEASIDWSGIDDALMKEYSVGSYCSTPLEAMQDLCASPSAKQAIASGVSRVRCRFGGALELALDAGEMRWTTDKDAPNQAEFAVQWLERNLSSGKGETLGASIMLDETGVCTDGRSHFVVVAPHETQIHQLFVGDAKTVVAVPIPPGLPGSHFFDPRHPNQSANPDFRGVDMRVHSKVEWEKGSAECNVTCGERALKWKALERDAAKSYLLGARLADTPRYAPHALLRDAAGRYFLVDRNTNDENDFRVFVGKRGSLAPQPVTEATADSAGEVLVTAGGELRRAAYGAGSMWVAQGKEVELVELPLAESWSLIYGELGVYAGAPLGTPCDAL